MMFAKQQFSQLLGRIRLAGVAAIFLLAFWGSPQAAMAGGGGCADFYFMDCSTKAACETHQGNMCIGEEGCSGTIECWDDPECPEDFPSAMMCAVEGGSAET